MRPEQCIGNAVARSLKKNTSREVLGQRYCKCRGHEKACPLSKNKRSNSRSFDQITMKVNGNLDFLKIANFVVQKMERCNKTSR